MARDIAGFLTGIGSTQQPVQQAVPGTPGFRGQFGAARAQGLGAGLGGLMRRGAPSAQEQIQQAMGQLDLTKVDDLAKLARIQQARGDLAGAAQTANKIQAIRERERLIKENEEQKLLDEQTRTAKEQKEQERWEAGQKLKEDALELQRQRLAKEGEKGRAQLLKDDKKAIRSYEDQASNSSGEAYRALDLANRYASMSPTGGVVGRAYGAFKSLLGAQTEIDSLKTEFTRLSNTGIINSLPPGVASDRDISLISEGFPDSSWSPKEIERFLRAVAKISAYDAERNAFRAKYVEDKGGVETGFTDAWREKINEPGYKEAVAGKYGFEYDIPETDVIFDADRAKAAAAAAAEQRERGQRITQTPSSSAQSVAEAFK
jgi:hypothetical protein